LGTKNALKGVQSMIEKVYKQKKPYEQSSRTKETINTRINRFKHFTEIIYYNEPFDVYSGSLDYHWVDTSTGETLNNRQKGFIERKLKSEIEEVPIEFFEDNARSNFESRRRAKDNFYGYALCNDWTYFCTFTISKNEYEHTDQATKYWWRLFRKKLQYHFPDVKILAVPERHKSGNIHFHALIGNANLENILTVAINPKTQNPIFHGGRQVYNLPLWNKGFSTVVKIDQDSTEHQLKTINYCIGYVTKQDNIGLNQKRYYRTKNLDFKNSQLSFTDEKRFEKLMKSVADGTLKLHKANWKCKIFRIYN